MRTRGTTERRHQATRVLLVHGSPWVRLALARTLIDAGCTEVRCAAHAQQALTLLRRYRFDALITALRLRRASGIELLRFAEKYRPTMIRILHTTGSEAREAAAVRDVVDCVLARPVGTDELRRILEHTVHDEHRVA